MNYKEKYEQALERAQKMQENSNGIILKKWLWGVFPELKESEGERIRKAIIRILKGETGYTSKEDTDKYVAWLEKQGKQNPVEWSEEDENIKESIKKVLANTDFNKLDIKYSFYEMITWLEKQKDNIKFPNSAYTSNEDVDEFADKYSHIVWEKLMNNFKKIENYHIGCNDVSDIVLNAIINTYIWLKGQEKQKKVSIWKHWKNGITGNGEGKHTYLIKTGNTYTLSSCLGFECDYIELSELDNLMLEKQGKQTQLDYEHADIPQKDFAPIKPKFKVGDWIVDKSGHIQQVLDFRGGIYTCTYNSFTIDCESNYHLWTIADAKDGDVLTNGESIVIFKQIVEPKYRQHIEAYIGLDWGCNIQVTSEPWLLGIDKTMPANKVQRDLLFQKMKEAGYEWDADKKELKKIEPNKLDANKVIEWLKNNR